MRSSRSWRSSASRRSRHPNYLVVVAELLLVPLLVGCRRTALVGSLVHAPVLLGRIRREDAAWARLGAHP